MTHVREKTQGSFRHDLDWLLEQLDSPSVIELGKPLPQEKFLQRIGAARCPAAHNRVLLDRAGEETAAEGCA